MAAAARTIDVGEFINSRKLTRFNVILVVVSIQFRLLEAHE